MKPPITVACFALCALIPGGALFGFVVSPAVPGPTEKPALSRSTPKTQQAWKNGLGAFGERVAEENLTRRGFTVLNVKISGGQGLDRVGIRRGPGGKLVDVRIVEVKTHRGSGKASMAQTQHGRQMSREWLAHKFRQMRGSPDRQVQRLAQEIGQFRKEQGIPIERLGEIHEINIRNKTYTIRGPDGTMISKRPIARRASTGKNQQDLLDRARTLQRRQMIGSVAGRPLAQRISGYRARLNAGKWLNGANVRASRAAKATSKVLSRSFLRASGPLGTVVAASLDARELYRHWKAYQTKEISRDQFRRRMARTGGGIAGAGAGAAGGAYTGAAIGAWAGPWGMTIGAVVGGGVGGVAGYLGGSRIGEEIAASWIARMDDQVKGELDRWLVNLEFH